MTRRCPPLAYSYDSELFSLHVCVGGLREYTYEGVSPYHVDKFRKLARRNRGKALNYLKSLIRKEEK